MERIKACYKNVGEKEKTGTTRIVFVKTTENATGKKFTESSPSVADALMDFVGLFTLKLDPIGEKTVD